MLAGTARAVVQASDGRSRIEMAKYLAVLAVLAA
jgi:hypothetical protein